MPHCLTLVAVVTVVDGNEEQRKVFLYNAHRCNYVIPAPKFREA